MIHVAALGNGRYVGKPRASGDDPRLPVGRRVQPG